jgi:hypothetical protein
MNNSNFQFQIYKQGLYAQLYVVLQKETFLSDDLYTLREWNVGSGYRLIVKNYTYMRSVFSFNAGTAS